MKLETIAVLLTCFNRSKKTLACLQSVVDQQLPSGLFLSIYLVDDGSTDDTATVVSQTFPQVRVIQGNGNLFWNGGMRLAFTEASKQNFDAYLWLNDDTVLFKETISCLVQTYQAISAKGYPKSIVVGSTKDPDSASTSYGGIKKGSFLNPFRFSLVSSSDEVVSCDTMNGNCVFLPSEVTKTVGNLDASFAHDLGDFDYGLRAKKRGCSIWVMPGYAGSCPSNPHSSRIPEDISSIPGLIKRIMNPKGLAFTDVTLHPFNEWCVFCRRHGGLLWPALFIFPYRRLVTKYFYFKQI